LIAGKSQQFLFSILQNPVEFETDFAELQAWFFFWVETYKLEFVIIYFVILAVGNIPYDATEEQLIEICREVGPVVSFRSVLLLFFLGSCNIKAFETLEFENSWLSNFNFCSVIIAVLIFN